VTILDTIIDAKKDGAWERVCAAIPYVRWLGIETDRVEGEQLCKLRFHPELIGNPSLPALHGGTIGALLESTAIFQLLWEADEAFLPKTITLTVDYLRTGKPVDTFAKATVTRFGRRVATVRAEAWQDDRRRPIATANAHFLILGRDEKDTDEAKP
jgi:uncharacterized protein (TIGR00369 family)